MKNRAICGPRLSCTIRKVFNSVTGLIFRQAVSSDIEAIARLHALSWQQHYRGSFSDSFLNDEVHSERRRVWTDRLIAPVENQWVCLAEKNGELVGFACVFFNDSPRYGTLLDNLHVSQKMKRQGIGAQLMGKAAQEIEVRYPGSGMYLWVLDLNKAAQQFYSALQGKYIETVKGKDVGEQEVIKLRYHWPAVRVLME